MAGGGGWLCIYIYITIHVFIWWVAKFSSRNRMFSQKFIWKLIDLLRNLRIFIRKPIRFLRKSTNLLRKLINFLRKSQKYPKETYDLPKETRRFP